MYFPEAPGSKIKGQKLNFAFLSSMILIISCQTSASTESNIARIVLNVHAHDFVLFFRMQVNNFKLDPVGGSNGTINYFKY